MQTGILLFLDRGGRAVYLVGGWGSSRGAPTQPLSSTSHGIVLS